MAEWLWHRKSREFPVWTKHHQRACSNIIQNKLYARAHTRSKSYKNTSYSLTEGASKAKVRVPKVTKVYPLRYRKDKRPYAKGAAIYPPNGIIFLSGMSGVTPENDQILCGWVEAHTTLAWEKIKQHLESLESSLENIVKIVYYIPDRVDMMRSRRLAINSGKGIVLNLQRTHHRTLLLYLDCLTQDIESKSMSLLQSHANGHSWKFVWSKLSMDSFRARICTSQRTSGWIGLR